MAQDTLTVLRMITEALWIWTLPVIFWFGTIGNCLCIFASLRTEMRNMISRHYFFAWAVVNEGFIISWTVVWVLYLAGVQWYDGSGCHIITFTPMFCRFLSVYVTLALIAERFISICRPQHQKVISVLQNTKKTIAGITICGFIYSTLYLWIVDNRCGTTQRYENWRIALYYINFIVVDFVPPVIIIVLSIQIIMKTRTSAAAGSILQNPTTNGTANISANQRISNINVAKQMKLTRMIAIVAIVSTCLDLPSHIISMSFAFQPDWIMTLLIVYNFLALFSRASSGINFYICWIIDKDYRQAAYDIFHCRPRIDPTSLMTNTHGNTRCDAPLLGPSSDNATALQDTATVLEMSSTENAQVGDHIKHQNSKTA